MTDDDSIAGFCKPQIDALLAQMDAPSRERLGKAAKLALEAIENQCPVAMELTPRGLQVAYGPVGLSENMILSATASATLWVVVDEWLNDPPPIPPGLPPVALWAAVARATHAKDAQGVGNALAMRFGAAGLRQIRDHLAVARGKRLTPIMLALSDYWESERQPCGIGGIVCLPSSLEQQVARIHSEEV